MLTDLDLALLRWQVGLLLWQAFGDALWGMFARRVPGALLFC